MKKVSLTILLAALGAGAHAATCPAPGYYLDADGNCTICELGYYCPGDNTRKTCAAISQSPYYADEEGMSACKTCPTIANEYKSGFLRYWYWIATDGTPESYIHPTIYNCNISWTHTEPHGTFLVGCKYSTTGYEIPDMTILNKCFANTDNKCDGGYYIDLSNPVITTSDTEKTICTHSYHDIMFTEFCVPVGPGYYSPANAVTRTACPKGTYSDTDTAAACKKCPDGYTTPSTGATSINACKCAAGYGWHGDDCLPLCDAGATSFHAGGLTFNLYPNETCDSPAIRIGLAGGTCCVFLEQGAATGAVNIEYDGEIYHTTN